MDDRELDALLARPAPTTSPQVRAAVAELVSSSREHARAAAPAPARQRRRRLVGAIALAAVALTAGGTLTAAQLDVPPFQTVPAGVQRLQQPVPVDYVTSNGKPVRCQAFLEFHDLTDAQVEAAEDHLAARDWSGFGQQAYDTARRMPDRLSPDPVDTALGVVIGDELTELARAAVPGVEIPTLPDHDTDGPTYNGYAMSCPTGQR